LEPKDIDDLAVVLSLENKARFENRFASDYLDQRNGKIELPNLDLRLKEILGETYGVLLYQEQIMEIVHRIGGMAKRDGFNLVQEAMSKKSLKLIDDFREKFVTGAKENQIETSIAEKIYDSVVHQGQFTQCKANAINAAIIGYQMAFLKAHHPEEFSAADAGSIYAAFHAAMMADLKANHPDVEVRD
jgi:DNA polymerase-3 subunit alpha